VSIVISTIRRKALSLLLRAVFMQFCDHLTITYRNCKVSNLAVEHYSLLTIPPRVLICFQFFLLLGQWRVILTWLFVFQAIDFKTAKYVTGLECCLRVGMRENSAFMIRHQ